MAKSETKKSEAKAFLDETAKGPSQASVVPPAEVKKDSADKTAGEAGPKAPKSEAVKPAAKAPALSEDVPGKYRKFVK